MPIGLFYLEELLPRGKIGSLKRSYSYVRPLLACWKFIKMRKKRMKKRKKMRRVQARTKLTL